MEATEIPRSKFITLVVSSFTIGLAGCSGVGEDPKDTGDGDVKVETAYEDDISTNGSVTVADDAVVKGDIAAGSHADIGSNATINGSIEADEVVTIREDTRIDGDVIGGTVEIPRAQLLPARFRRLDSRLVFDLDQGNQFSWHRGSYYI